MSKRDCLGYYHCVLDPTEEVGFDVAEDDFGFGGFAVHF